MWTRRRPRPPVGRGRRVLTAAVTALAVCAVITVTACADEVGPAPAVGTPAAIGSAPAQSPSGADCRGYLVPVTRTADDTARHSVYAELCLRGELAADTPVQVLLHGGTYDHSYWDWSYQPQTYSYVEHATKAGFATLNIDRLGYGQSDRPDPHSVDFQVGGYVVHQLVQRLRGGGFGHRFHTVVLNGHSMGGIVAERAAALGDVDAVIVSGIAPSPGGGPDEADDNGPPSGGDPTYPFYPAEEDPKFAGEDWPTGYLTTRPGTREQIFLFEGTYDRAVVPVEESLKDTLTFAELQSVRPGPDTPEGSGTAASPIPADVPVAHVLGRYDVIACSSGDCLTDPAAEGADQIVAISGHSINISRGAPQFYEWTIEWLAGQGIDGRQPGE